MSVITSISIANHGADVGRLTAVLAAFVASHKGDARPDVDGYNRSCDPGDLEFCSLQAHRASESIQDKSLDERFSICHTPAYD